MAATLTGVGEGLTHEVTRSMKKWPTHPLYAAVGPAHVKVGTLARSEGREWAPGETIERRKPFEVDSGGRQVGLDLHVGETMPQGARRPCQRRGAEPAIELIFPRLATYGSILRYCAEPRVNN